MLKLRSICLYLNMSDTVLEKRREQHVLITAPPYEDPPQVLNKENWVNATLEKFHTEGLFNRSKIALIDNFPPQYADYYKALQEKIAEIVPVEAYRPLICLNIRGSNRGDSSPADIGMAGGMGPLSDATILENLVLQMSDTPSLNEQTRELIAMKMINFSGVMYSMPPPRTFIEVVRSLPEYLGLYKNIRETLPCTSLHILSNTGHLIKSAWQNDLFLGGKALGCVYDMTAAVANEILKKAKPNEPVLILGTKVAADKKLYQNLLESRGLTAIVPGNSKDYEEPADYLQKIIEEVKAGNVNKVEESMNGETYGDKFIKFVIHYAKKTQCKSLLFSCTELPMLLHTKHPRHEETYFDLLHKEFILQKKEYIYYDSEEIFVESIKTCSNTLQNHPEMRSTFSQGEPSSLVYDAFIKMNEITQGIEEKLVRLQGSNDPEDIRKKELLRQALRHLEDPIKDFQTLIMEAKMVLGKGSTTLKLMMATGNLVTRLQALKISHKVFEGIDISQLKKIVTLDEEIVEQINQLSDNERNQHKKNVLRATLQYLRNPDGENHSLLEAAKLENARFKEAPTGRISKTADLVVKTTDLIQSVLEKNKVAAVERKPSMPG